MYFVWFYVGPIVRSRSLLLPVTLRPVAALDREEALELRRELALEGGLDDCLEPGRLVLEGTLLPRPPKELVLL